MLVCESAGTNGASGAGISRYVKGTVNTNPRTQLGSLALACLLALSMQSAPAVAAPMHAAQASPIPARTTPSSAIPSAGTAYAAPAETAPSASSTAVEADPAAAPEAGARAAAAKLRQARGDTLTKGQRLARGTKLVSKNGRHALLVSKKGKLRVLNWGRTRWHAGTKVRGTQLKITGGGRLVLTSGERVVWRAKARNVHRVTVGDNGNVVAKSKSGKTVWHLSRAASKRLNKGKVHYYSQNNRRWSRAKFGAYDIDRTGCLPTSFAMAISAFRPRVSPRAVAKYMWDHGDYNHVAGNKKRSKFGAGAYSIEVAAEHYGVMASPLRSRSQINRALKQGRTVIALERGPSIFTGGRIHVVVLSGYSKGMTTVIDPWKGRPYRTLSTKFVWSWKTNEKQYRHRGSAFWAIG